MTRRQFLSLAATAILAPPTLMAAKKSHSQHDTHHYHGRIHRSQKARCEFLRRMGYKNCKTPKGYIVDHKIPLACGGPDTPENMVLQTVEAAKAKDKWERKDCQQQDSK